MLQYANTNNYKSQNFAPWNSCFLQLLKIYDMKNASKLYTYIISLHFSTGRSIQ